MSRHIQSRIPFLVLNTLLLGFPALTACGALNGTLDENSVEAPIAPTSSPIPSGLVVSGSVSGAFALTVDGARYEDSEEFYSQEVKRLPGKIKAAGFEDGWTASLDALVGLSDLKEGMRVYLAPVEGRGHVGESILNADGTFEFRVPESEGSRPYQARAVKRINVGLTRTVGEELERRVLCYNFSASTKALRPSEVSEPLVLTQFTTRLTAYDCQATAGSSLNIPAVGSEEIRKRAPSASAASAVQPPSEVAAPKAILKAGSSPEEIEEAWGTPSFVEKRGSKSLRLSYPAAAPADAKRRACVLGVEGGALALFEGCAPSLFDLVSFQPAVGAASPASNGLKAGEGASRLSPGARPERAMSRFGVPSEVVFLRGTALQTWTYRLNGERRCQLGWKEGGLNGFGSGCPLSEFDWWLF